MSTGFTDPDTGFKNSEDPAKVISPKVIVGTITSLVLIAVVAAISAITPDLFSFLGDWKGVAFAGVVAIGAQLSAYLKNDPLRK